VAVFLWTQKQDIGPKPRAGHGVAHDSTRARTVLFGGTGGDGPLSDTWEWAGGLWTQVQDSGPPARTGCAMAFDAVRHHVVLFGGRSNGALLGDTWRWDGEDWTQIADIGPSPRSAHALAFDSAGERIVLFGGETGSGPVGDTWGWDGLEWTQLEDIGPAQRRAHVLSEDVTPGRIVLFGGAGEGYAGLADTWAWDGTAWSQVADTGPSPRAGAAMVRAAHEVLLFGGIDSMDAAIAPADHDIHKDTWRWDGSEWTQVQDIRPAGRWLHSITYEPAEQRVVLFGGLSVFAPAGGPIVGGLLGDTWAHVEEDDDNAIYVAPDGDDAALGSIGSAKRTIAAAVAAAAGTGRAVRVAAGTYDEGPGVELTGRDLDPRRLRCRHVGAICNQRDPSRRIPASRPRRWSDWGRPRRAHPPCDSLRRQRVRHPRHQRLESRASERRDRCRRRGTRGSRVRRLRRGGRRERPTGGAGQL
jgi:hypothetical protein